MDTNHHYTQYTRYNNTNAIPIDPSLENTQAATLAGVFSGAGTVPNAGACGPGPTAPLNYQACLPHPSNDASRLVLNAGLHAPAPSISIAPIPNPKADLPNKEVKSGSGVYEIHTIAICDDGQQRRMVIRTDIGWDQFRKEASNMLGSECDTCKIEVRHLRASTRKWVWVMDANGWVDFMSGVQQVVRTARQNPVTLELRNKPGERTGKEVRRGDQAVRRGAASRDDNIPDELRSLFDLPKDQARSSEYFSAVRDRTFCQGCTSQNATDTYCLVVEEGHGNAKSTHRQIDYGFMAKWVHLCMQKKASTFTPPNCLLSNKARPPSNLQLPIVSGHTRSPSPDLFSSDSPRHQPRRRRAVSELYPTLSSPDLPEPEDLVATLIEKEYEKQLIPMPTVRDALEALSAVKPLMDYTSFEARFVQGGYLYVDQIAKSSVEEIKSKVEFVFDTVVQDLFDYCHGVTRYRELETLWNQNNGSD